MTYSEFLSIEVDDMVRHPATQSSYVVTKVPHRLSVLAVPTNFTCASCVIEINATNYVDYLLRKKKLR